MGKLFSAWPWFACVWFHFNLVSAADLRLSVAGIDDERRPTLVLSGLGAGNYGLQASTNMLQWFDLATPPSRGTELRFLHSEATKFGTLYYRGIKRQDTSVTPQAPIVAQVDSNNVAVAVVTFQEGGSLSLTNDGGTRFTFTVAPSNVLNSVAITMQFVTNFNAFPFENEMRSAVKFEPEGFRFHGAGLLEIQFPTNVPHLKLSSFGFGGQGGDFHLVPDLVNTNSVRIPVTHFSVFGTAVWGPTERTKAFETRVENVESANAHRTAELFGLVREQQLLGCVDCGANSMAEVIQIQQDYVDRQLKPQFEAAGTDCSLFRALTPRVLGIDRQQQLLGITHGENFFSTASAQKAMCNCLEELVFACIAKDISAESFFQGLLGIERQGQLLGLKTSEDCGTGSIHEWVQEAQNKKLECITEWVGTIKYSESGTYSNQRSRTFSTGGATSVNVQETIRSSMSQELSFEGGVERVELEDDSIPGLFESLTWNLYFYPDAKASYSYNHDTFKSYECRKDSEGVQEESQTHKVVGAGSGDNIVKVYINVEEGEVRAFTILETQSLKLKLPAANQSTDKHCPKKDRITGEYREQPTLVRFSNASTVEETFSTNYVPTEEIRFTTRTRDEIVGTATGQRQELLPREGTVVLIPYKWEFSLKRRKE